MFDGQVPSAHGRTRRKIHLGAIACLVVVSLSALSTSHAPPVSAAATSSSGCGSTSPGSTTLTPKVNGFVRTVIVYQPKHVNDSTPLALVLNLHGSGSTALDQEAFSGMDQTANVDEFLVAYPQALIPSGVGFDWNVPDVPLVGGRTVPKNSPSDIKFLTTVVKILEQKYCVNTSEVYATGFSGGARETSQLACDDSRVFAAVAPVSGLRRPLPCPTTRAVPVISFHGSADPVDPFAGHGQKYWTYSVSSAAKDWAGQDACSTTPVVSTSLANVKVTTYSGCSKGAEVELYEVMGEGHEWPGGPTMPSDLTSVLGPQSNAVSANDLMWSFFLAHPLS